MAAARAHEIGARHLVALVVLGQQHAGNGDLASADVAVRVDRAGHHHTAVQRVLGIDARARRRRRDDLAVLGIDVPHLSIDAVHGVVDAATGELYQHSFLLPETCQMASSMAARMSAPLGSVERLRFLSGSDTTLSHRTRRPA